MRRRIHGTTKCLLRMRDKAPAIMQPAAWTGKFVLKPPYSPQCLLAVIDSSASSRPETLGSRCPEASVAIVCDLKPVR